MADRREFTTKVKLAAFERAAGRCEKCTARLVVGKFAYDHVIADALGGEPTLENCQALCSSCHGPKSAIDTTKAAKVKRTSRKLVAGIRKRSSFPKPPPGTRYDWKLGRRVFTKEQV
jgi:5-methylcytosine-specific restriction endonuclease McrA